MRDRMRRKEREELRCNFIGDELKRVYELIDLVVIIVAFHLARFDRFALKSRRRIEEEPKQKSQSTYISMPIVSALHVLVCMPPQSAMSMISASAGADYTV